MPLKKTADMSRALYILIEDYIYLVSLLEYQYHAKVAAVLQNKCSFLDIPVIVFGTTANGGQSV